MKDRLAKILGNTAEKINIHTFHSLCFGILKENYKKAGLCANFRIITKNERDFLDKEKTEEMPDFDDLVKLTLKLFSENEDILSAYRHKFLNISVDEYQDIDEDQYKLIRMLAPSDSCICVIGDPDQSIYGFRGGDAKFFNNFKIDYPNAMLINLKNNYRSADTIVNASNQMIQCFNIIPKCDKPHEKITVHTAPTDKAEAEFIVSTIENLIGGHSFFSLDSDRSLGQAADYSFSDFAVLYRASAQIPPLIEAFERSGMPFSKFSNNMLCENKSVRNILKSLDDIAPLNEQIKEFKGKIDDNILESLVQIAQNTTTKEQFIHEVSLMSESDTLDSRGDRISIMTLHASKGLEFKCVFIAGLEDEILPFYTAKTQEEIEEEKRLLYVGMTRAQDLLFLSHAIKRKWRGGFKNLPTSPFLVKINDELLKLSEYDKKQQEKDKSQQLSLF